MPESIEPLHDLVRSDSSEATYRVPASPRVTPEPAPSDSVLIAMSVATGVVATLGSLAVWRWWRNRRR